MIGILQNLNLTDEKLKKIEQWHLSNVQDLIENFSEELVDNRTIEGLKKEISPLTIDEIIISSPSDLKILISSLPHKELNKYILKYHQNKHIFVYLYDKYRQAYGSKLVKKLELSVCPYCNKEYISSKGKKTPAQFDHFFNKKEYPILALSLYNLIPCCATCNKWKSTAKFNISPYYKKYKTDDIIQFSYTPKDTNDFSIEVKALITPMEINVTKLELKERYSIHEDILNELIEKHRHYVKAYKLFLENILKANGVPNGMALDEFYYGNYLTQDKYYKRPLSKFTRDIIEELDNINNDE